MKEVALLLGRSWVVLTLILNDLLTGSLYSYSFYRIFNAQKGSSCRTFRFLSLRLFPMNFFLDSQKIIQNFLRVHFRSLSKLYSSTPVSDSHNSCFAHQKIEWLCSSFNCTKLI